MKNLVICFFSILFVFPISAFGYGYPAAMGQGSPVSGVDAVVHGFGGVMSVNVGGMNLFGNPAELSNYNPTLSASIGPVVLKQSVDDGLGKHTLTYAGLGASSLQAGLNTQIGSIALGIARIRDYVYTGEYFFIESNPSAVIAGFENLTVRGSVWEAATGYATVIPGNVSIGASAGYRTGEITYDYYWHHFSEFIPDSSSNWSREEGEFSWRAGASVPAGDNISFGAVYSSKTDNCPSTLAAGLHVGDIAAFSPGFGLEARIYDLEDSKGWAANVFGGIHPDHKLFFRGGVVLSSDGGTNSDGTLGLYMGSTIDLGRTDITGAFNFGSATRDNDVFGFPEVKTVTDVVTAFTIGATIEL